MRAFREILGAALVLAGCAAAGAAPVAERVGENLVRFHASEAARRAPPPSPALLAPLPALGAAPTSFRVRPVFQSIAGRAAARLDVEAGTSLYGTGEVPGPLLRNGRRSTGWNFDAYGWNDASLSLYQSHPWVLAVRADGTSYGVLAETPYRTHVDLGGGILFIADGPAFPLLVVEGSSPQDVVRALGDLTGRMPLPPLWALGYHQCRYSYYPEARLREIAAEFRRRRIPCDVLWLDIDYMDGFRSFTFHPTHFPAPQRLGADLHAQGFRTVTILDPGIKLEPGYFVYDSGTARDVWVRRADGGVYTGVVWPGTCVFPDFTRAAVRAWWGDLCRSFVGGWIDGIWNDMNEPAVFHVDSKTMPMDAVHGADSSLGGPGPHARYHNIYGMQMARATWEGLARARPERRPFVLSRANHLGGQRWAAAWTGDNSADWWHLDASIPMVLNLGLSGQPFAGPDIGGFSGAGDGRMFARWMGIGALLPFARGHTGKGNIDKEPWAFGAAVEATCRRALQRRYRLLPYLYTLFEAAARDGLPPARPLFFAAPAEARLRAEDDAFLLGDDVLVVARTQEAGAGDVARPPGIWRRFDLEVDDGADADLPELWLRAGAIVPVGPVMDHSGQKPLDPLQLVVCLDDQGRAEGWLYEDAGDGYGYRDGAYRRTRFTAQRDGDAVNVGGHVEAGTLPVPDHALEVRLLGPEGERRGRGRRGTAVVVPLGR
jgi:alpha-glucosidase